METGTQHQPKNHETNRKARAAAMVKAALLFEKNHKTPATELVRNATSAEWHYLLKMSYALVPISSREEVQPSDELKALVRFGLGVTLPVAKTCKCGATATRTASKAGLPGTDVCGSCWARAFVKVVEEIPLTESEVH